MAKPNVHTAAREELLEAGARAEVVDEIMKRRRRKGGVTLDALGEVPGVGPATLEQLGKTLDFKEPPPAAAKEDGKAEAAPDARRADDERGRGERTLRAVPEPATDAAEAALRAGTGQAADLVAVTVQGGAEVAAHGAETVRDVMEAEARASEHTAGAGLHGMEQVAETAAQVPREAARRSAEAVEDASAFGRAFLEFLHEQGRENVAAVAALSRAKGLEEVVRVQGEHLRASLERMTELNCRWLELAGAAWPTVRLGEDHRVDRDDAR